jgi:hypothetical protein
MHLGDEADGLGAVKGVGGQQATVRKRLRQMPGDGDAVGQEAAVGGFTTGTVPAPPKAATSGLKASE